MGLIVWSRGMVRWRGWAWDLVWYWQTWVLGPKALSAFFGDPIVHNASSDIFLNEAIAIITAIQWSTSLSHIPAQLVIHTESNSFNILDSLQAPDPYNAILMSGVSIWIDHDIDLHIEGKWNVIVDDLLYWWWGQATNESLHLSIHLLMQSSALVKGKSSWAVDAHTWHQSQLLDLPTEPMVEKFCLYDFCHSLLVGYLGREVGAILPNYPFHPIWDLWITPLQAAPRWMVSPTKAK